MKLPSSVCGVTTETVGLFRCSADPLARWLAEGMGAGWGLRPVALESLEELCRHLAPGRQLARQALIPWGDWTMLLTDGPLGTDPGVLPSQAARDLGCVGIRATAVDPLSERYDAVMLDVYDPAATDDLLRCRRGVTAADDGGRWVFEQYGEPFEFEDLAAYRRRRVRDRFTADMLHTYLAALGVPLDDDPSLAGTLLVESAKLLHRSN